jgi:hypothetical protein
MRASAPRSWYLLYLLLAAMNPLRAQEQRFVPLVTLQGETAERGRLRLIGGADTTDASLLRSPSRVTPSVANLQHPSLRLLSPEVRVFSNSALPFGANTESVRAGRGVNVVGTAGIDVRYGPARLILGPQLVYEQNLPFQVIPYSQHASSPRSPWANPFHPLPESIDLPFRYGDVSHRRLEAGQSSLTVDLGAVAVGAATENEWWGPGIRNALLLSDNAAGFPHLFARAAAPVITRAGVFDFDLIFGRLHESEYFDHDPANDAPSLSAGALTWRPGGGPGLQLGFAHLRLDGNSGHDQMNSLFGRWVFVGSGLEAYAEWAHFQDPPSLRAFLEIPNHEQGYTVGLQWAHPLAPGRTFRLQTEESYLEPDASFRIRPVTTSYTSSTVPQGFTNRGKVLGASIGPGSSSQWVAGDVFATAWRVGLFLGRIRYDNGTLFGPLVPELRRQDVSLLAGLRASGDMHGLHTLVEFTDTARLNYLYQAYIDNGALGTSKGVDISNRSLAVTVTWTPGH